MLKTGPNAVRNQKGCDIGYALVASSCEGADNVDACTVTALDVITAFAVPNLNCSSQSQSIFSGLAAPRVASFRLSLSLLRTGNVLFSPTLSTVDVGHIKVLLRACQRSFNENQKISVNAFVENQDQSSLWSVSRPVSAIISLNVRTLQALPEKTTH